LNFEFIFYHQQAHNSMLMHARLFFFSNSVS
jgi:hypothetical protein